MLSIRNAASIDDLRSIAKRRLPRFAFDFLDGGAESEANIRRNRSAFKDIALVPRYLAGVSDPVTEASLFGKSYAAPFGIAPMGFLNMAWPGADLAAARLAARVNIPHAVSTASSTSLETLAEAADGNAWFQLYLSDDAALVDNLLGRAQAAGYEVLLVTVDVCAPGKRDRDVHNGLTVPFKFTPGILADLALHPRWSLKTLSAGAPNFGNFGPKIMQAMKANSLGELQKRMISSTVVWDDMRKLRDRWKGQMLIKGVLHPADATMAINHGFDGIVVSNHGGRQVDYGPSAIEVLPGIVAEIAGRVPVLMDSGIRRGADILKAKALGADLMLSGRAFAYGLGAAGPEGPAKSYDILMSELRAALGQLGVQDFSDVDGDLLWRP